MPSWATAWGDASSTSSGRVWWGWRSSPPLIAVWQLVGLPADERIINLKLFTWIPVGDFQVDAALLLDPLSAVMILVVTGVGFLIHVYSVGYMADDESYARYFTYLNLFMFSMLILVLGQQLPATVCGLGTGRPLLVSADRLLVHRARAPPTPARRRLSSTASATSALRWASC